MRFNFIDEKVVYDKGFFTLVSFYINKRNGMYTVCVKNRYSTKIKDFNTIEEASAYYDSI